ncbi:MAG: T9SS type A sorting domain-containing protein [Bacteroidetes bacterium]|nr:T9SS type A sorting domain-containing protein [Bacteroidota bacterium]
MRKPFILASFLLIILNGFSQNLVPNPGFNLYNQCPIAQREILKAIPWFTPSLSYPSTDFFHSCNSASLVSQPTNYLGYQEARTEGGYAGIVAFRGDNTREYLEVGLSDSLLAGKNYNVEFYVSLAENSKFAIDKIGLFFSKDMITYTTFLPPLFYCYPQIFSSDGFITDVENWTRIKGVYTASGGERFITIGNFSDNATTNILMVNPMGMINGSNYYVDDVSVIEDVIPTDTTNFNVQIAFFSVYPNPAHDYFVIEFFNMNSDNSRIELFDVLGRKVMSEDLEPNLNTVNLDVKKIASGMYFYKVFKNDMELGDGKIKIEKL